MQAASSSVGHLVSVKTYSSLKLSKSHCFRLGIILFSFLKSLCLSVTSQSQPLGDGGRGLQTMDTKGLHCTALPVRSVQWLVVLEIPYDIHTPQRCGISREAYRFFLVSVRLGRCLSG